MKKLLLIAFVCSQIVCSQNSCFDVLFEGYNITSVTDDHQFIWLGTVDNGLIEYDKDTSDIQFYNTSNSTISSNSISSVLKSNNRLYVSTDNSLMAFSNNEFQNISTTIQGTMAIAPNGNLAVAAPYEFNIIDLDNEIVYSKDLLTLVTNSCCGKTTDITYDENGKLWLSNYAFYEYDILTYDGLNWEVYDVTNSILPIESPNFLNGIASSGGVTYASNWSGLFQLENNIWTEEHTQVNPTIFNNVDNIDGLLVNAIEFDLEGDLWIGAGEYDNTGSGKIAFRSQDVWNFIYDDASVEFPGVNVFKESQYDFNIMYAATNDGLLVLNKNCLRLSTEAYSFNPNSLVVFPNPTTGLLNFARNTVQSFSYKLCNALGQVVSAQNNFSGNMIDISELTSGYYMLIVETENSIETRKIFKY